MNAPLVISARNACVTFQSGRITDIAPGDPTTNVIALPGFIDLQVNGIDEIDFGIARDEFAIASALDRMTKHGTTACLATIVTAPFRAYEAMLDRIRRARDLADAASRCTILGVHLEGPFLGGAPGAHPQHLIRTVDLAWLRALIDRHRDLIAMVTLAPEADPDFAGTRLLADHGILVSLGHSSCSFETAIAAADAGARCVTHLYNGMSGLAHRSPGLATAALLDARLTPTLIADLHHVAAPALRVALAARSDIALITDAVAPGAGESGGMQIEQRGGAVYLPDGTMAGAVIHMDDAVRNIAELGIPLEQASLMASTIPARLLGCDDRGTVAVGQRADCVLLDAETLAVVAVYLEGAKVVEHR